MLLAGNETGNWGVTQRKQPKLPMTKYIDIAVVFSVTQTVYAVYEASGLRGLYKMFIIAPLEKKIVQTKDEQTDEENATGVKN